MSHQLPPLSEPAQQQQYICTKCGKTGPGTGEWHDRLDGTPCGYMALHNGPWFTADQMRAYAELAIASVKREPLSFDAIMHIACRFGEMDSRHLQVEFVRAIEQAHGIGSVDKSPNLQGKSVDKTTEMQGSIDGIGALDDKAQSIKYPSSTASPWLPIESAPKDGTPIHCGWFDMPSNPGCNMRAVKFHMGAWWECNEDFKLRPPSHWMPLMLPPPPPIKISLTTDSGEDGKQAPVSEAVAKVRVVQSLTYDDYPLGGA